MNLLRMLIKAFFPSLVFNFKEYDVDGMAVTVSRSSAIMITSFIFIFLILGIVSGLHVFSMLALALILSKGIYAIPVLAGYVIKNGTESKSDLARTQKINRRAAFNWILTVPFIIYLGQFSLDHPSLILGLMIAAAANFLDCIRALYKINLYSAQ